jgi:hypothetical protein
MTFDSLLVFFETTEFVRQSNLVIFSDRIIIDTFLGVNRCRHLLKKLFDQSCTEMSSVCVIRYKSNIIPQWATPTCWTKARKPFTAHSMRLSNNESLSQGEKSGFTRTNFDQSIGNFANISRISKRIDAKNRSTLIMSSGSSLLCAPSKSWVKHPFLLIILMKGIHEFHAFIHLSCVQILRPNQAAFEL